MKESFYFSNMCPQHPQLNRRGWKNLEEKIRDWAIADSDVIVICGPSIERESKTIGKNKVAVPQQFCKVVLSPFIKPMRAIGFLFNNEQATDPLHSLRTEQTSAGDSLWRSLPSEHLGCRLGYTCLLYTSTVDHKIAHNANRTFFILIYYEINRIQLMQI